MFDVNGNRGLLRTAAGDGGDTCEDITLANGSFVGTSNTVALQLGSVSETTSIAAHRQIRVDNVIVDNCQTGARTNSPIQELRLSGFDVSTNVSGSKYFVQDGNEIDRLVINGGVVTVENIFCEFNGDLTDVEIADMVFRLIGTANAGVGIVFFDSPTVDGFHASATLRSEEGLGAGIRVDGTIILSEPLYFEGDIFNFSTRTNINKDRVLVNGVAEMPLGGSPPSDANWREGDIVEDTDNAGDAYQKLPNSGFSQIST